MNVSEAATGHLPLSPRVFHVMLALATGAQNGYQLALGVQEATGAAIRMGPGTLYENLNRLQERGLIRETTLASRTDRRRQRFWRLTALGRDVLKAEVERLRADVAAADAILALGEG